MRAGLRVGVGFWDWEALHPFFRLLVKPRSFLKVSTAWVGRNSYYNISQVKNYEKSNTEKSFICPTMEKYAKGYL